jgi:hypothetical protein
MSGSGYLLGSSAMAALNVIRKFNAEILEKLRKRDPDAH